jgi:cohesin complex subunit SA-1/2
LQTNPREYPLISTKKVQFRKFPKRLQEFFRRLLTQLSAKGLLSDPTTPTPLDKIQQWVFSLSSTNFRPFRHTATAISLGLISTLADIYAKVAKALDSSNVLLEKERRGKKKGAGRVKDVERIVKEQEGQLEVLNGLMESTYDSVFVHRFRDVDHRIRTECVHELGLWMQKLPQVYFDGSHLRYMGWALSDAVPPSILLFWCLD